MLDEGALAPLGAIRRTVRIVTSSMPEFDSLQSKGFESIAFAAET
jgi:hypothetical protein